MFNLEDYHYDLPQELIAQEPAAKRDHSRLFVVNRKSSVFKHGHFYDLPELLNPGDLIVVNNTKVFPARMFGRKESGGRVEILVLESSGLTAENGSERLCLMKSSKRPRVGTRLIFDGGLTGKVEDILEAGMVRIVFQGDRSIDALLDAIGQMPLPPYIKRGMGNNHLQLDKERYQTVYSTHRGAVAAPTAGLHFTGDLIEKIKQQGISVVSVTLHVGYGTFQPVRTPDIRNHVLGEELYTIEPETADAITKTRKNKGRVVAVGTTVVRTLETAGNPDGNISAGKGKTGLLITPGHSFKVVDALITNFHLPKSSLLFLVSAFAGLEKMKSAYAEAVIKGYRFYSYGDAMFIK